ncbi:MAG: hypothetical protein AAF363_18760 [Bacteroidota bacterium]
MAAGNTIDTLKLLIDTFREDGRISGPEIADIFLTIYNIQANSNTENLNLSWNSGFVYDTPAASANSGNPAYAEFGDRLWKSKVDNNQGNEPPSDPLVTENPFWIEVSKSVAALFPEWTPGIYGAGLIIVFFDNKFIKLENPSRPFESIDIVSEIANGDWVNLFSTSGTVELEQTTGQSTTKGMTQKAITDELDSAIKKSGTSSLSGHVNIEGQFIRNLNLGTAESPLLNLIISLIGQFRLENDFRDEFLEVDIDSGFVRALLGYFTIENDLNEVYVDLRNAYTDFKPSNRYLAETTTHRFRFENGEAELVDKFNSEGLLLRGFGESNNDGDGADYSGIPGVGAVTRKFVELITGLLSSLNTSNKSNLAAAINEVLTIANAGGSGTGSNYFPPIPFDASGNTLPTSGNGSEGSILANDKWLVTVEGEIPNLFPFGDVEPGDMIYALVNNASDAVSEFVVLDGNKERAQNSDVTSETFTNDTKYVTPLLFRTGFRNLISDSILSILHNTQEAFTTLLKERVEPSYLNNSYTANYNIDLSHPVRHMNLSGDIEINSVSNQDATKSLLAYRYFTSGGNDRVISFHSDFDSAKWGTEKPSILPAGKEAMLVIESYGSSNNAIRFFWNQFSDGDNSFKIISAEIPAANANSIRITFSEPWYSSESSTSLILALDIKRNGSQVNDSQITSMGLTAQNRNQLSFEFSFDFSSSDILEIRDNDNGFWHFSNKEGRKLSFPEGTIQVTNNIP